MTDIASTTGSMRRATVLKELSANWQPLAGCALGIFLGCVHSYSIGAFLEPVARELGRSIAEILGWSLCWSIGCVLMAPATGYLSDRFGAKRVAITALVLLLFVAFGTALWVRSLTGWYISAALNGIAASGAGGIAFGRLVSVLFERGLGTALGIMSTGIGMGALVAPRAMQAIIDAHGWRTALVSQSILLAATIPVLLWLFRSVRPRSSTTPRSGPPEVGHPLGVVARTPVFWLMAVGALFYGVCVGGVQVNLMLYLGSEGIDRSQAATLIGVYGVATVLGRLLTGLIIDRIGFHVGLLMTLMLAIEGGSFVLLSLGGASLAMPALILFGFVVGAEADCLAYLVNRLFGRRFFSSIFGVLGIMMLYTGTGIGPGLFDLTRQATAGYTTALLVWTLLAAIGAAAFLLVARTPYLAARTSSSDGTTRTRPFGPSSTTKQAHL
jgi:MFS family permease